VDCWPWLSAGVFGGQNKNKKNDIGETMTEKQDRKTRVCLKCSRTFSSSGPGNRICGKCRTSDTSRAKLPKTRTHSTVYSQGMGVVQKNE